MGEAKLVNAARTMRASVMLVLNLLVLSSAAAKVAAAAAYEAPEPYAFLHGAQPTALPPQPSSPDPLVAYAWHAGVNASALQQLAVDSAVAYVAEPASSFDGLESLTDPSGKVSLLVKAPGWIRLDYGLERPAWLEGISAELAATNQTHLLRAAISEYDEPYDGKTEAVKPHGKATWRLETKHPSHETGLPSLYEGVRFAWLCFAVDCPRSGGFGQDERVPPQPLPPLPPPGAIKPWRLTSLRLVAKLQPVRYTGVFRSSDARLEKIWYSGAYGVRANMQGGNFGSILIDRGDRNAFQGDGHPSMATAEAAFAQPAVMKLLSSALQITDCHTAPPSLRKPLKHTVCRFANGKVSLASGSYPVYWTLSVADFYWASSDNKELAKLLPDVRTIVDEVSTDRVFDGCLKGGESPANCPGGVGFIGWDDRTDEPQALRGEQFRMCASLISRRTRSSRQCWARRARPCWRRSTAPRRRG